MSDSSIDVLNDSVFDLAKALHARHISPTEVLNQLIKRIEEVNPHINALVANRFELAHQEAKAAEQKIMRFGKKNSQDKLPPLLGVPCSVKEIFALKGMPNSVGIKARQHICASHNATAVDRLQKAGAIIIGTTNVPEGGMWVETYNHVYGRTKNPWDTNRSAGGSSGGEAALVATGASPFGLASDLGGSIRIPANFCGVVGHKPTGRMVPNTGCWPNLQGNMSAYLGTGPIGRKVRDMMPLLKILAGPDGHDTVVKAWDLQEPSSVHMRDVVVYPIYQSSNFSLSDSVKKAMHDATAALQAAGARIAEKPLPNLRNAAAIWSAMLAAVPSPSYAEFIAPDKPIKLWQELLKLPLRRSDYTSAALMMCVVEQVFHWIPKSHQQHLVEAGVLLQAELESMLGTHGVILHPCYSRVAPRHRAPMLTPLDFAFCGIFNVMEFPATSVPVGFDAHHMPTGVQIAARRGNDHLSLAVAQILEDAFGGWQRANPTPTLASPTHADSYIKFKKSEKISAHTDKSSNDWLSYGQAAKDMDDAREEDSNITHRLVS